MTNLFTLKTRDFQSTLLDDNGVVVASFRNNAVGRISARYAIEGIASEGGTVRDFDSGLVLAPKVAA